MVEAIDGTTVRNNARDKAERDVTETNYNKNKRKVELDEQKHDLGVETEVREVRQRGEEIVIGHEAEEEVRKDLEGLDSHSHRNEKRKAKHRVGNDGQEADNVK
eukprot:15429219-Heterocapsa_arctica.AAC.1